MGYVIMSLDSPCVNKVSEHTINMYTLNLYVYIKKLAYTLTTMNKLLLIRIAFGTEVSK